MNIKIQGGGGGKYANTGSSFGCAQYLNHENNERIVEKKQIEPFFDNKSEKVDFSSLIQDIDQNKGKLSKKDEKFYVLTISPSEKEIKKMGNSEEERSVSMKAYTRQVMDDYAKNFEKGLKGDDLVYYAKIHHGRGEKDGEQMHAHVIVSRMSNNPDRNKKARLCPTTNFRKKTGNFSGFDRTNFFQKCEDSFDEKFENKREYKESFVYQNALKNGTVEDIKKAVKQADLTPIKQLPEKQKKERKEKNVILEQSRHQDKEVNLKEELQKSLNRNESETFKEALKQPQKTEEHTHKRSRGMGIG